MSQAFESARKFFLAGGPVMWPLLGLSILSLALIFERAVFWFRTERPGRGRWLARLTDRLRAGDASGARAIIAPDTSLYASFASSLLERGGNEHAAVELVEESRRVFERFAATLSTIITAAPLLGLLGTVTGIINSLQFLGARAANGGAQAADPTAVATGLAEALITTAFGLIIAIATVFPYTWFRACADRCLGRLESMIAAVMAGQENARQRRPSVVRAGAEPAPVP